jgi:hypothetical protein
MRLIERSIELNLHKQGLYEIEIDGSAHRLCGSSEVRLTDDSWKRVSDLSVTDDVMSPLEVRDTEAARLRQSHD